MPLTTPHPGRFDGLAAIHREVKQFRSPAGDFFLVVEVRLPQILLTAMELSTGRVFQCRDPHSSPLPYLQLFKEIGRESIRITSLPSSSKGHYLPHFTPSLSAEKKERQQPHQPPGGLEKRRSLPKKLTAAEAGSILKLDLSTMRHKEREQSETTTVSRPELRFVLCSKVSKSFEASEFVLGQVEIAELDRLRLKEAHSMFLVNELTERLHLLEKAVQGLTSAASAPVQAVPSENVGSVVRTTSSLKNMARHKPSFPDPSYDSGWMQVPTVGQSLVLDHKLNLQLFNNLRMYYMFDDGRIVYIDGLTSSGDGQYGLILTASDPDYVKARCAVDGPAYLDQVDREGNRVRTFATHFRVAIW